MLKALRPLLHPKSGDSRRARHFEQLSEPPAEVAAPGAGTFPVPASLQFVNELPALDWDAVSGWLESVASPDDQAKAWASCELAWLQHLRVALGPGYRIMEDGDAVLLSSLEHGLASATLGFMNRTQRRITRVLDGIAVVPEWGKDILIVFDDQDTYYRYVSRYYQEDGEFAGSSGMHINRGCGHFVTVKDDLRSIEPVIAHEMTHSCVSHLPIPAWLNEGLAVNTEHRLCPPPPLLFTPQQMHEKHLKFWGAKEIQEFWSGKSFGRADDGNMLSYDLARILVEQFSSEWEAFKAFTLAANLSDAGASAAQEHLGVDLGVAAAAILEREGGKPWHPDPGVWNDAPEKGAFRSGSRGCRPVEGIDATP